LYAKHDLKKFKLSVSRGRDGRVSQTRAQGTKWCDGCQQYSGERNYKSACRHMCSISFESLTGTQGSLWDGHLWIFWA